MVHTKYLDGTLWLVFSGTFLHVMNVYSESYSSNTRLEEKKSIKCLKHKPSGLWEDVLNLSY